MIVHRLDYATSGVLLFARNEHALKDIHRQFREKNLIFKRYTAIIAGVPSSLEGQIDHPIGRDQIHGPPLRCVDVTLGKPSLTNWVVQGRGTNQTYVQLTPLTGRTHQLRVHLSAIGHPILGDFFYAPDDVFGAASRLMLHAEQLGLTHPTKRKEMLLKAPCPLAKLLQ
jgi:tRNA pseudouridine32 synthase / 23S rRNA pseudouridine746 synthase